MLNSIILCNTGADSLSFITLDTLEVKKILFALSETPVGPHGIRKYKDEKVRKSKGILIMFLKLIKGSEIAERIGICLRKKWWI